MERESPAPWVTIRPRSRMPVALAVLLVLLQLFSPHRVWVILLCGVGAMLPREHLLGGSPDLERTVVMQVVTDDPPPVSDGFPDEEMRPRQTFYWRGGGCQCIRGTHLPSSPLLWSGSWCAVILGGHG